MKLLSRLLPLLALALTACAPENTPHDDPPPDETQVPTTLVLTFTPEGGGDTLSFQWSDPENDGAPIVDDILLPDGSDHNHHDSQVYTLDVQVFNELDEDVTPEIADLDNEHLFFFTGSAVEGPATGNNADAILEHAYADEDADGLPVGLSNTITTLDWGEEQLTVTLRHLPVEDDQSSKVDGLPDDVAADGFDAIGGDNTIQVTFNVDVE